jgi:hypothetical protein
MHGSSTNGLTVCEIKQINYVHCIRYGEWENKKRTQNFGPSLHNQQSNCHLRLLWYSARLTLVLMMEALNTCETFVSLHQITRRNMPEDGHLRICHQNLKSHQVTFALNSLLLTSIPEFLTVAVLFLFGLFNDVFRVFEWWWNTLYGPRWWYRMEEWLWMMNAKGRGRKQYAGYVMVQPKKYGWRDWRKPGR